MIPSEKVVYAEQPAEGGIRVVEIFSEIMVKTNNIMDWVLAPGFRGINKLAAALFSYAVIFAIFRRFFGENELFIKVSVVLVTASYYLYALIFYLKRANAYILPQCIVGCKKCPLDTLKEFTDWAYIYGISIFALLTSTVVFFILSVTFTILFGHSYFLIDNFFKIFFLIAAIYTYVWFMYHMTFSRISLREIKIKIMFYVAITTTLSVLVWPTMNSAFRPMVANLGMAYAWLLFILEKVNGREKTSEKPSAVSVNCR